jgi:hypothetical protein
LERHGETDRDAVCDQLERILASLVFRNSKRYSSLLKHVVERVLDGRPEDLKERNIGVDVFGRAADYDTNSDHVVRSVAGEVRRRLAQYYMEPGREGELRIELLTGSYVPQFRTPASPTEVSSATIAATAPVPVALVPRKKAVLWRGIAIGAVALLTVVVSIAGVRWLTPVRAFGRFWNPVLTSTNTALLCVGGGGQQTASTDSGAPLSLSEFERQPRRRMHTSDALALAGLAAMLQSNGKAYRILNRAGATSFRDLQSGPFVLIGGMNNEWTLRLTNGLRFGFERTTNGARVIDRQNPLNVSWSVDFTTPIAQFSRDYAIVSRIRDPQTEQPVVITAGIGSWGTLAASEFVTNPDHLKKLERFAPSNWEQKNLQVVIATDVIRASSGPPMIVAAYFW